MRTTVGWRTDRAGARLQRASLERRELRRDDVAVRVDYCGVCHSDLHAINAMSEGDQLVPGHEFTGVVTGIGSEVDRLAVGDAVAIGNIVDSCGRCAMCLRGQENFCRENPTLTYGGTDRHDSLPTMGGYSREYVASERFTYPLPSELDAAAAAPLLCAGVTVWEPLRALQVTSGTRVAVVGMGGLGHLAVKFAVALGAEATVISRTADKTDDARRLGAHDLIVSTNEQHMTAARDRFDVVIDTIAVPHDVAPYLRLVALDGTLSQLGHLGPVTVQTIDLLIGRKKLSSAGSGGRPATAAMLEFCAKHNITADIELLPSAKVNEALYQLEHNAVRYRIVLDMSDLA